MFYEDGNNCIDHGVLCLIFGNRTSPTSVSVLKMIGSSERRRAQVMVQMENKMKNTHRPNRISIF